MSENKKITIIAVTVLLTIGMIGYVRYGPSRRTEREAARSEISTERPPVVFSTAFDARLKRPTLDECPPAIEVSFQLIEGQAIVVQPLAELDLQIQAKVLCLIGNQIKLLDYVDALERQTERR